MRSRPARNSGPLQAGIYCRISLARIGDNTKVEDQEYICRKLSEQLGWAVAAVYSDHSKSAWRKDRKRPAWDQMLADVEAGRLGAIVVYHGDRLVRQPFDLETLLNLSDAKGIKLASPTGTRDLDDPNDRFVLRILTAQACMESDNTSRRKKGQYERMRRSGLVRGGGRGGRAYGFATDGVTHLASECEYIREMAGRVLAGESAGMIARDVSARGARTPTGGEFSHGTIRKMLARPRYAGLMPDGENAAAWEPVLDRQTWEAVCLILAARADGFAFATNARRWLLSGIAECGAAGCGSRLQVKPSKGRGGKEYTVGYACPRPGCRKVYRSAPLLDAYVSRRVVNKLANPANPDGQVLAGAGAAAEFQILAAERAKTEAQVRDYQTSPGRVELLMARLDSIDTRLAGLRELAGGDARSRILSAHAGISREEFAALPLATRRALVAACYRITVLPASRRGPGFRTEDVQLSPR
jgi:DNA invertase Pin-like site-specific DNA recombinase